ncbi:MAG: DUF167 domain-containing protein [Candidatus Paceibacterota bacterium]|jgi:uncharacterized protein (TIGR00251 family)
MLIKVKVITEAKRESIKEVTHDSFRVSLTEAAEQGRANGRLLEIMRKLYAKRSIKIIKGHHSRSKILEIV